MNDVCAWKENEDGYWETECDHAFEFTAGDVAENEMVFCPYCGKPIAAVAYVYPVLGDDDE